MQSIEASKVTSNDKARNQQADLKVRLRQSTCTKLLDIAQSAKEIKNSPGSSAEVEWTALLTKVANLTLTSSSINIAPSRTIQKSGQTDPNNKSALTPSQSAKSGIPIPFPVDGHFKSTRQLTTAEKVCLLESSKLNGLKFPPWDLVASQDVSTVSEVGVDLTMNEQIPLSPGQIPYFSVLRRAREALGAEDGDCDGMKALRPSDLTQDVLPDCSLVASLIVLATWRERMVFTATESSSSDRPIVHDMLSSVFESYDQSTCSPRVSMSGTYRLRFFFNGAYRRVIINDMLPVAQNFRLLHLRDIANRSLIWPALLEKAYLTVRGGYAHFAGSCPASDLFTLVGWIPEQIHLQRDHGVVAPKMILDRIRQRFEEGEVVITLGTGAVDDGTELEKWHTYAVIGMREEKGACQFLIRNPLGRSGRDGVVRSDPARWIDLQQVILHFDSLYLNWDPRLFVSREDFHFKWDLSTMSAAAREEDYLTDNPQFVLSTGSVWKGTVWVLLTRHFQDRLRGQDERNAETPNSNSSIDFAPGFISLLAFDNAGFRVLDTSKTYPIDRARYVDVPFCLLRLDMDSFVSEPRSPSKSRTRFNAPITLVVSQQNLPSSPLRFSLSVFCTESIEIGLERAAPAHRYATEIKSEWTDASARLFDVEINLGGADEAGNAECSLPSLSPMVVLLESIDTGPAVVSDPILLNVKLAKFAATTSTSGPSDGSMARRILADSGNYMPRCCSLEAPWELFNFSTASSPLLSRPNPAVGAVKYSLLVSTYKPGASGRFRIRCFSKYPVQLRRAHDIYDLDSSGGGDGGSEAGSLTRVSSRLDRRFVIEGASWDVGNGQLIRTGNAKGRMVVGCLPIQSRRYARVGVRLNVSVVLPPGLRNQGPDCQTSVKVSAKLMTREAGVNIRSWVRRMESLAGDGLDTASSYPSDAVFPEDATVLASGHRSECVSPSSRELEFSLLLSDVDLWPCDDGRNDTSMVKPTMKSSTSKDGGDVWSSAHALFIQCVYVSDGKISPNPGPGKGTKPQDVRTDAPGESAGLNVDVRASAFVGETGDRRSVEFGEWIKYAI